MNGPSSGFFWEGGVTLGPGRPKPSAHKDAVQGAAFLLQMGNSSHAISKWAAVPRAR